MCILWVLFPHFHCFFPLPWVWGFYPHKCSHWRHRKHKKRWCFKSSVMRSNSASPVQIQMLYLIVSWHSKKQKPKKSKQNKTNLSISGLTCFERRQISDLLFFFPLSNVFLNFSYLSYFQLLHKQCMKQFLGFFLRGNGDFFFLSIFLLHISIKYLKVI